MTTLYIKTHNTTKLKYFGKTIKQGKEFDKYQGSGTYWLNHIKKHGYNVTTEIYVQFEDDDPELIQMALKFSSENDIVESMEWANLKFEDGRDGGFICGKFSPEAIRKISESKMGKPRSKETREKISMGHSGKILSEIHKHRISESNNGSKRSLETKKKMSVAQLGKNNAMFGRKHTNEAKEKISKAFKGENHPLAILVIIKDLFGYEIARGVRNETMRKVGIPVNASKYVDDGRLYADISRKCDLTRHQKVGNLQFCGWTIETI